MLLRGRPGSAPTGLRRAVLVLGGSTRWQPPASPAEPPAAGGPRWRTRGRTRRTTARRQAQSARLRLVVLDAPAHRGPQVGMVGLEPVQPGRCRRTEDAAGGLLGERQEVVGVPRRSSSSAPLAASRSSPYSRMVSSIRNRGSYVGDGLLLPEQTVPLQRLDAVQRFAWRIVGGAQLLDRRQAAAAVEDRQWTGTVSAPRAVSRS